MKLRIALTRKVWFAAFGVGLLLALGWVVTQRGPLAPINVTVTQVVTGDVSPALFGIGTVEAQRAYLIGPTAAGRVSIARALANKPPVILADEPTGPLDSERALAVMHILNQMASQYQTAIIVVTHDEKIIPTFKRIYNIRDGQAVEEAGEGRIL